MSGGDKTLTRPQPLTVTESAETGSQTEEKQSLAAETPPAESSPAVASETASTEVPAETQAAALTETAAGEGGGGGNGGTGKVEPAEKEEDEETEEQGSMGLMEHFRELRNRLLKSFIAIGIGFAVCWFLRSYLVDFLYAPLLDALRATNQPETIIATGVGEKFFTYMKIAFVGGIFVGSPLIFYQLWAFIAPGLYDEEKVYIVPVAVASALFFVMGGAFCYFMVFPNALPFLLGFGEEYMQDLPRLSEYYDFALRLLFAFGLIFELPLFVFFLARLGIVTAKMLSSFRRYFIVIAFIVGAVLTPPDVMSQLLMAAPMLLLYEFSIIIARVFGRQKKDKAGKKADSQENETPDKAQASS